MKAQITQYKINLPKLFLVNWVRAGTSNSLQYLIGLKSNTVKIYSVVQSVKLLLALSIYIEPPNGPCLRMYYFIRVSPHTPIAIAYADSHVLILFRPMEFSMKLHIHV